MKGRESGMPEETSWERFFDAGAAIDKLAGGTSTSGAVVEFGCGYGTFTLAVARRTTGLVTALDIEPAMIERLDQRAAACGLSNIRPVLRDFVAQGTGLGAGTQETALIFNLLHIEQPVALLRQARRTLRLGGRVAVMHWRSDIPTPRGPSLPIRPNAEQCRAWLVEAGFQRVETVDLQACCPFHFGLTALR